MKGFFGAFCVFLLWSSVCIYFVSTKEEGTTTVALSTVEKTTSINNKDLLNKKSPPTPDFLTTDQNKKNPEITDSIYLKSVERETSFLLAEEIKKSIAISDTIDIAKDEPELEFKKEIENSIGPALSSKLFYPHYNNTDLILDKELISHATELKKLLQKNPDKKITILGHTDNVGSSQDNFNQGLKKSRQIKWYLTVRRGIPRSKVTATSRGEEEPIASNKTLSGRRKNNRIEIIID